MVRIVDRTKRRNSILAASVDSYIHSATPVSSESLAQIFNLSGATVRSILAELEESGYLTHPYTSAGRVPTDEGYRYYVDFLMSQMQLLDEDKQLIVENYKNKIERLEDILEKTSGIISAITHYAGIVSFLEREDKLFYNGLSHILEQPEFQETEKIRLLIQALEERRRLLDILNRDFSEQTKVYIGSEMGCPQMQECSLIVAVYHTKEKDGKIAVLGPRRMNYNHIIPALEFISEVLSDALS